MCSNCKANHRLRDAINEAVKEVKSRREELAAKINSDGAQGGFDCCDLSEAALCKAIVDAVEFLGIKSQAITDKGWSDVGEVVNLTWNPTSQHWEPS